LNTLRRTLTAKHKPAAPAAFGACASLLLAAAPTPAAQIQSLTVTHTGARYKVDLQVKLQAPAAAAYAVFAAPGSLPQINPAVQEVDLLKRTGDDQARLYTEVRVCAALFCKTLHQVQEMHYAPRPDGGDLEADVLPGMSDFRYGHAQWHFRPDGPATQLHFTAEMEPAFWIPPLLGPWLVERSLHSEAERTSAGIERLARLPEVPPVPPKR
jgi:hypothetical protein